MTLYDIMTSHSKFKCPPETQYSNFMNRKVAGEQGRISGGGMEEESRSISGSQYSWGLQISDETLFIG